jgi:predicted XRE-type DNA-binding protein
MNIIVTAASETGVGKTTLAAAIAMMIDQHGWTADKAAVASAAEYDRLYDTVPPGSCLILDEAEKAADARRGMTKESVTLTQSFATKRYRQVFSVLTAPSKSWVDNRLGSDAADYWIQAMETDMGRIKGEAKVYRLKTNEHYETDYAERTEYLHWPNLDDNAEFQKLDRRKRELLESDTEHGYVDADDVDELKANAVESATEQQRREVIEQLNDTDGMSQDDIADLFDITQSRVSQIVNGK